MLLDDPQPLLDRKRLVESFQEGYGSRAGLGAGEGGSYHHCTPSWLRRRSHPPHIPQLQGLSISLKTSSSICSLKVRSVPLPARTLAFSVWYEGKTTGGIAAGMKGAAAAAATPPSSRERKPLRSIAFLLQGRLVEHVSVGA